MNKFYKVIGIAVSTLFIFAIPILFGLSLAAHWHPVATIMLGISTIFEALTEMLRMYYFTERE